MAQQQASIFVERVKEALHKYEKQLELDKYPLLNQAHTATKQPRIYIVMGVAIVAALIAIRVLGLSFISNLFAFIPIYASFKALRSVEKEDDEYWLTYVGQQAERRRIKGAGGLASDSHELRRRRRCSDEQPDLELVINEHSQSLESAA